MKKVVLLIMLSTMSVWSLAQTSITLDSCQKLAKQNYPLIKQLQLIEQTAEYSLANASKAYLPQFTVVGQATYQNEVVNIPTGVLGQTRPVLDKDQYRFYAEMNQNLYDGGHTRLNKKVIQAQSGIDLAKVSVDLYALADRVNQLYFGLLILREQKKLQDLLISDLSSMLAKIKAMVGEGAALKSNEDALQADLIKARQRETEIMAATLAYEKLLSFFTGLPINNYYELLKPLAPTKSLTVNRPELSLFTQQQSLLAAQSKLLGTKVMPKLGFFAQGGYAYPGFDFFKDQFDWFYIGGIRLNWTLSNFYTQRTEQKMLQNQQSMVSIQQEVFLFNLNYAYQQQITEEDKFVQLMATDEELIEIRNRIKDRSAVQLAQGIIQASDYLREVNASDMALQNKLLHELQWLQVQYNQKNNRGN